MRITSAIAILIRDFGILQGGAAALREAGRMTEAERLDEIIEALAAAVDALPEVERVICHGVQHTWTGGEICRQAGRISHDSYHRHRARALREIYCSLSEQGIPRDEIMAIAGRLI